MFAILSAIIDRAMASQPSAESPDHEHGQQNAMITPMLTST
jgi:hypothetical protein